MSISEFLNLALDMQTQICSCSFLHVVLISTNTASTRNMYCRREHTAGQDLATMWCEKPSASSWCNNRYLIKNYNSILNPSKKSVKFWMLTKYHVVALCTVRVWMISGYSVECLWSMAACICPLWANNWSSWRTLRLWAEGQGDQW